MYMIKTGHKRVESGIALTSYTGLWESESVETFSLSHNLHYLHFTQPLGIPVARPAIAIVA
jgi:hypothetical protein